jgi:hypothetical protein
MLGDQDLILDAIAEAQRILSEYNASTDSQPDSHEVVSMLSFVLLEKRGLAVAINRLRSSSGAALPDHGAAPASRSMCALRSQGSA